MRRRGVGRPGLTLHKWEVVRLRRARAVARRNGEFSYERRLRAILLAGRDRLTQESVGFIVDRSANCITRWVMAYKAGGVDALVPRKAPGHTPRLDESQMERLHTVILEGPEDAGLDTGVWTGPIVQALIEGQFGVVLSVSQVRRIMHKSGLSVQRAHQVSSAGNPARQAAWRRRTYPEIKKKPSQKEA